MAENTNSAEENCDSIYNLLLEVFESCISVADLTEPVDDLIKLYDSFTSQGFESNFEKILMITLSETRRSSDVQKIFKFISEFSVSLDNRSKCELQRNKKPKNNNNGDDDDEDDYDVHPFLKHLFKTLISWTKASSYVIRSHSCQLLYLILTRILDIGAGEIDSEVYESIATVIQACCKDVSASVRSHGVMLAKFFQDPSDHSDPVIAALCWQLARDPCIRVRQNIVEIIAACEETIIPITQRFLYDKNYLVRNAALLHICHRISPRSYTPQHRILILNQCFSDPAAIVRKNASQKLIPMWFRAYGDKLCLFFKSLRLGNDCIDKLPFARPLLNLLFKLVKISQILEEIDLDPQTALPKCSNGEKFYIWRHFYAMAYGQEKLKKFVPQPEKLIEFLIKCFTESAFDEAYAYNELISFTMDAIDILGEERCEKLPPLALDIMRNPFTPADVIPYAVTFYCEYATKETKEIHDDLLQTVHDLMKFVDIAAGEEQKKLILKCLDIFSETLAQDNISASIELMTVKDELVLSNLESEDLDIKARAFRALSLYCLLDLVEAKQFLPYIEKSVYDSPEESKLAVLKGALDICKCYGGEVFGEHCEETSKQFEDMLLNLLSHAEEYEIDLNTVLKGMLKLYLSHHTYSPLLMARLFLPIFLPDEGHMFKKNILNFLELYGESKEEAECLTKSFLSIINLLYTADRENPYYKINVKTVVHELLEFSKNYEDNQNFDVKEKFSEVLPVKLTAKFLKKPSRMSAMDLQDICEHLLPKDIETLKKLKTNVKLIAESLQSPIFQQKNPFTVKSQKFFTNYQKKIQTALDNAPDEEISPSQRLNSTPDRIHLPNVDIESFSPLIEEQEKSF